MTKKINIVSLVNNDGCFDLQFRKDTRKERTNSPTYYRWKAQFVVTSPKSQAKNLKQIQKEFGCGNVTASKDQARFSVQKIDHITGIIIPYFKKNALASNKKSDFELWVKAAEVLQRNKGVKTSAWKKTDLYMLIEIQKSASKYKNRPRKLKWLEMAKAISQLPPEGQKD